MNTTLLLWRWGRSVKTFCNFCSIYEKWIYLSLTFPANKLMSILIYLYFSLAYLKSLALFYKACIILIVIYYLKKLLHLYLNSIYQIVINTTEMKNEKKMGSFYVIFMKITANIKVCIEEIHKSQKHCTSVHRLLRYFEAILQSVLTTYVLRVWLHCNIFWCITYARDGKVIIAILRLSPKNKEYHLIATLTDWGIQWCDLR